MPVEKVASPDEKNLPLATTKRAVLGQFFTPPQIASFMASLFQLRGHKQISLLDAGAGVGSLTRAFLEQVQQQTIPRSFCNGLYYRPFREFILAKSSIKQIHLFDSRDKAFKEDGVLQENIILHLVKGARQGDVKISTSTDDAFQDYREYIAPFERIVPGGDPEKFIHIPENQQSHFANALESFTHSLADLGIEVSTGPVVDFRVKDFLCKEPQPNAAPLLYPAHFGDKNIQWPKPDFKKSNALIIAPETRKHLFPSGHYTLVRRFSSKEERRRIVARVVGPGEIPGDFVGFENHLNVFHQGKKGLPEALVLGLAVFLNSTMIDHYFRQFNGHTQVNATDLRMLKYPEKAVLMELGKWAKNLSDFDQEVIDSKLLSAVGYSRCLCFIRA